MSFEFVAAGNTLCRYASAISLEKQGIENSNEGPGPSLRMAHKGLQKRSMIPSFIKRNLVSPGVDPALEFRRRCAQRFLRAHQTGFHRPDSNTQGFCHLTC